MKNVMKKDISIKIISVLIAVIIWFYVLNIDNPYDNITLTIPISFDNRDTLLEKGLVLKDKDLRQNIDVTIRGRKEVIKNISINNFVISADFSKVKSEKDTKLQIEGPFYDMKDISVQSVNPRTINIQLEKIKKNTFPVEVVLNGNLAKDFKIVSKTQTPEFVELEDIQSLINTVDSVRAVVDINNLDKDLVIKKECKVYNKDGKEIPELSKNCTVDVVLSVAKEVPITVIVKGKPAEDYIEGLMKINPEKALIKGTPETLSKISDLKTEPIDIENLDKSVNVASLIVLPKGVTLVDIPQEVAVDITIEQLARKEFTIARDSIMLLNSNSNGLLSYDIKTESINLVVKGKQRDLSTLSLDNIGPYIDVGNLEEGLHKLPLKVNLPVIFNLLQEYQVEVKIDRNQE